MSTGRAKASMLTEGATVVRRDVLDGKVWSAAPFRVITHSGGTLVTACWPGAEEVHLAEVLTEAGVAEAVGQHQPSHYSPPHQAAGRPSSAPAPQQKPTGLGVSLTWHPEVPGRSQAPMDRAVCFPGR
jgi:hypothetical protein